MYSQEATCNFHLITRLLVTRKKFSLHFKVDKVDNFEPCSLVPSVRLKDGQSAYCFGIKRKPNRYIYSIYRIFIIIRACRSI